MTFAMGVTYRLLVSPAKRFLWNIPTHGELHDAYSRLLANQFIAEWAIKYVQAEGTQLAHKAIPVTSAIALASPTFDPEHDYNSYNASQDKTSGRLLVSGSGLRFVSNFGHSVLWELRFDQLDKIEKVDRIVTKNVPDRLKQDTGQDLQLASRSGEVHLLKKVNRRDEAFSQIVGFSKVTWQVVW
jgi:hypothetical protein